VLLNLAADDSTPAPVVTPATLPATVSAAPAGDGSAAGYDAVRGLPRADGRHDAGATPQRQPSRGQGEAMDALPVFGSGADDEGESRPSVGSIDQGKTLAAMVSSSTDGSFPLDGCSGGLELLPADGDGGLELSDECRLDGSCSDSVEGTSVDSATSSPYASEDEAFLSSDEDDNVVQPGGLRGGLAPVKALEDYCAFLFLSGQCNVTEAAYDIFRKFFNADRAVGEGRLRCISTIRRTVAPGMRSAWGLPLEVATIPAREVGAPPKTIHYILPSTHVKRDVAFRATYDLFLAALKPDAIGALEPEYYDSPMHLQRQSITSPHRQSRFKFDGKTWTVGGTVNIRLRGGACLEGLVVGAPEYASVTAGLSVTAKVRAGDLVLPCLVDDVVVGNIVSPHWLTKQAAASTWCSADGSVHKVRDLEPTTDVVAGVEQPACFPELSPRRSIEGVEEDGEGNKIKTLTVAIVPFTDDFNVRDGKSTTAGTVAFEYPGWRYREKASRHAVRYVGVSPAGCCSDDILRLIKDDLRVGATTGWMGVDPDGVPIRVYVDVPFFVGDYVQVAKSSHMRGVRADAPCPLCSYRKPKEAGSQYAGVGDSSDVSLARTTPRTLSVLSALEGLCVNE